MTELDDFIPDEVVKIVDQYGRMYQWKQIPKSYDPTTNKTTFGSPILSNVKGTPPASCVVEYASTPSAGQVSMVQSVGMRMLTTPKHLGSIVPNIHEDEIIINGKVYLVVRVDQIFSGELMAALKVFMVGTDVVQ